jgi:predicted protein tyrosine phosphatase
VRLVVCPLSALDQVCREAPPDRVLTLLSPGHEDPPLPRGIPSLRLTFHDIAEPQPGLTAIVREQVEALLAFAAEGRGDRLLIHCWAGVSRSTAAAYAVACQARPDLDERSIAQALRTAAPTATPNPRLVALADELLERGGRMSRAVAGIGRGAFTDVGAPFELDVAKL